MMSTINLKYFKISEFDSPDVPGSGKNMKRVTLQKLEHARQLAGVPFIIDSGFRTPEHNKTIGGSPTSSHMKGWAVDISCTDSFIRERIVVALVFAGFTRLGISKTFIHADCDPTKRNAIWLYS